VVSSFLAKVPLVKFLPEREQQRQFLLFLAKVPLVKFLPEFMSSKGGFFFR
jgi:hypothetical protein